MKGIRHVMKKIYDATQHIDFEYIEDIIKKNQNKKIFVFGGGTAAQILMNTLLYKYNVEAFLDNNSKLWGTSISNIEIKDPNILKMEPKESCIVLILSKHVTDISNQLIDMGMDENSYDIYNQFKNYFRIMKFEETAYKFIQFLERIPDDAFDNIEFRSDKNIGIVCIGEMMQADSWYPMMQAVLLSYCGYKTTLIIDNLRSYSDIIYFEGIHNIAKIYIDYIVKILQKKCSLITVEYIRESDEIELDEQDIAMTDYYGLQSVKWFDARKDEVFIPNNSDRVGISIDILRKNLKHIKEFFSTHMYDAINVHTGIHRHRCLYTYIGRINNIRVSTYDGDIIGHTLYETDGVSGHAGDITKVVKGDYFTEGERDKIIKLAQENFDIRINAVDDINVYSYQLVGEQSDIEQFYDVIMPLNISWDSAALASDDLFADTVEWLQETVDYLMENTDATVMIREHPAQLFDKDAIYQKFDEILDIDKYGKRVFFCKAGEKLNTYQYIKKAKLVLPYTSTVGLESVMMNKPIVVHTKCYYQDMKFANKAKSKDDYFAKIKDFLENGKVYTEEEKEEAYIAYYSQMKHPIVTKVTECFVDWMDNSIEELIDDKAVQKILNIIAENVPAMYMNIKEELGEKNVKQ